MTGDPVTPRGSLRKKATEMETPVRVASPLILRAMQSSNGGHWHLTTSQTTMQVTRLQCQEQFGAKNASGTSV